ncbi:hypothetical protein B0H19DRAFT_44975 [Mycena capillaripes]|nr:hypothetical protein B0H19DRAFT_44975 [Mycena capillaripes]
MVVRGYSTNSTWRRSRTQSSKEGYKPFDDSLAVLHTLHNDLHLKTAVAYLSPMVLSEIEGVEKPSPEIFQLLLQRINAEIEKPITPPECVHVGDELECDYNGAKSAGMHALLLERVGAENRRDPGVVMQQGQVVKDMYEVLQWVRAQS